MSAEAARLVTAATVLRKRVARGQDQRPDEALAVAAWLEAEADDIPPHVNMWRDRPIKEAPAFKVADAVLGDAS